MTPRTIFLLLAATLAASGCGKPATAVFVSSEQVKDLVRDAQRPVQSEIEQSFGTPQNLVAWRKLPVDFGEYQGVVGTAENASLSSFPVTLTTKEGKPAQIDAASLKGSAIEWESGEKQTLKYELKGVEDYFQFRVASYDPEAKTLSVKTSPNVTTADASTIVPQPGEKFTIIGPVLTHGRTLYMTHCLHCHGTSGDGNGPTAQYLNPLPRDYRQGKFKFTSTLQTEKVSRDDLQRVVRYGIPGTYMPSFMLLKDDEMHAIVEYVRWLALRGETEQRLIAEVAGAAGYSEAGVKQRVEGGEDRTAVLNDLKKYFAEEFAGVVDTVSSDLADTWSRGDAPESLIIPKKKRVDDTAESRLRGRALYLSGKAKCATCHGPMGKGDGPQTEDYMPKPGSSEKYPVPGLHDDWGHPQLPRDLTRGIYRGGRRPLDIYRRVYAGIKGTQMPAFGGTVLTDDEIWDLVNYVMSIPFDGPGAPPKSPVAPAAPATAAISIPSGAPGSVASVSGNGGN
ncbi:MAG: c-type cytochrome [Planctomycetaceae bacterium]